MTDLDHADDANRTGTSDACRTCDDMLGPDDTDQCRRCRFGIMADCVEETALLAERAWTLIRQYGR